MGVSIMGSKSFSSYDGNKSRNPDPKNYKIIEALRVNKSLLIKINYPDCKNYEGNKILVYNYIDLDILKNQGALFGLDPHFSENTSKYSPIARFEPTDKGWTNAIKFCNVL